MSSKIVYNMHGFNVISSNGNTKRKYNIINNSGYIYPNHKFLRGFYINDTFTEITLEMKEGLEANEYLAEISNELEKICFNIITYSDVHTYQPICELKMLTNASGQEIQLHDKLILREELRMLTSQEAGDFYNSIMSYNTEINDKTKTKYRELFYILHNPHRVMQYVGLYDILMALVSPENKRSEQKYVHQFLAKNRDQYEFIEFVPSNRNDKENEDILTHIRNNIAHSREAGIDNFMKTSEMISEREVSFLLRLINDILSGNVEVKK